MNRNAVLFFDGDCALCNGSVKFILKHERSAALLFAPLQGQHGQSMAQQYFGSSPLPDSLILLENGQVYTESDGALKVCRYLKWYLRWLTVFLVLPGWLRNWVYRLVAKNRIKWFGRTAYCSVKQPKWANRFLDE